MKILIVEDEPKLNQAIAQGLQQRAFTTDTAYDGEEALRLARLNRYDAIILDVMLPKKDGFTVCRELREQNVKTPILFLTAKDRVEEKVEGLDRGGDDYLVKPFSFDELHARIRSVLRRGEIVQSDILTLDQLALDTRAQQLTYQGKSIELTLREYGLLEYFLRHQGQVVTRQDLLDHVWDQFFDSFSNVVDVHLKNLRKKLPSAYANRLKTIWGKGYRLN